MTEEAVLALELVARKSVKYFYRSRPQVHAPFLHLLQFMYFILFIFVLLTSPITEQ